MFNLTAQDIYGILRGNNVNDDDARRIIREMIRTSHEHAMHASMRAVQNRCNENIGIDLGRFEDWANAAIGPIVEPNTLAYEFGMDRIESDNIRSGRPVDDNGHPDPWYEANRELIEHIDATV